MVPFIFKIERKGRFGPGVMGAKEKPFIKEKKDVLHCHESIA
jgi:hypothetical protein